MQKINIKDPFQDKPVWSLLISGISHRFPCFCEHWTWNHCTSIALPACVLLPNHTSLPSSSIMKKLFLFSYGSEWYFLSSPQFWLFLLYDVSLTLEDSRYNDSYRSCRHRLCYLLILTSGLSNFEWWLEVLWDTNLQST